MRSELKKGVNFGNIENATNELIIYFDENLFGKEYAEGKKEEELIKQAKVIIDANLEDLKPVQNGELKFATSLIFNIEGVPEVELKKGKYGGVDRDCYHSPFAIFVEITAYAAEKVLGITLEQKGRKWFRKPGAPIPKVEAAGSAKGIKKIIEQDGCWGCKGIGVHTGVDTIDNPTSCPLNF